MCARINEGEAGLGREAEIEAERWLRYHHHEFMKYRRLVNVPAPPASGDGNTQRLILSGTRRGLDGLFRNIL